MSANALFDLSLTEPYEAADPIYPFELYGSMAWSDFELDQFIFGSPPPEHALPPTAAELERLNEDSLSLAQAAEVQTINSLLPLHSFLDSIPPSSVTQTAIPDASASPQPWRVSKPLSTTPELTWTKSQLSTASSPIASDLLAVSPLDIPQDTCDFTTLFESIIFQRETNRTDNHVSLQPASRSNCTDLPGSLNWLPTLPFTSLPTTQKSLPGLHATPTSAVFSRDVDPVLSHNLAPEHHLRDLLGLHPYDMMNACFNDPDPVNALPFASHHAHSLTSPLLEHNPRKRKQSDNIITMKKHPRLSNTKSPHLRHTAPLNVSTAHLNQLSGQQLKRANSKSPSVRKMTDSAHYRARNAFFMFRGFVSRIQCILPCNSKFGSPYSPLSQHSQPIAPRPQATGPPQTKVSVSCGKIWRSECFESCGAGGCANCRMRSLFSQASDYLKLRQAHIERRIEFQAAGDDQTGPWADIPLEDTFKWTEFQQLYHESDLFKWHRDDYLGQDGVLDVENLKRIWVENEESYEKTFTQAARQRIALEISGSCRMVRQRVKRA